MTTPNTPPITMEPPLGAGRPVHVCFDGAGHYDHVAAAGQPMPGFTEQEVRVLDMTVELVAEFCALPVEHPTDGAEFCQAMHVLQTLVLSRPGRRHYNAAVTPGQETSDE